MYFVGKPPAHAERLTETCFEAMWRGIQTVRPGARLGDIGHAIQTFVEERNYSDRKSTRLNSSHSQISYAVFCLKIKKHNKIVDGLKKWVGFADAVEVAGQGRRKIESETVNMHVEYPVAETIEHHLHSARMQRLD